MQSRRVLVALGTLALAAVVAAALLWPQPGPAQASGVGGVAGGGDHTCALMTASGVQCWGYNYFGQLGDATTELCSLTPSSLSPTRMSFVSISGWAWTPLPSIPFLYSS